MAAGKLRLFLGGLAGVVFGVGFAAAAGFGLGETAEQLRLEYDAAVTDHGTGRVTIVLTIADAGRLAPLRSVDLVVSSDDVSSDDVSSDDGPSDDGTNRVDLSAPLETTQDGGKIIARAHLRGDWAERAEIQLRTGGLDGKQEPLTWCYHAIAVEEHLAPKEAEGRQPGRSPL